MIKAYLVRVEACYQIDIKGMLLILFRSMRDVCLLKNVQNGHQNGL